MAAPEPPRGMHRGRSLPRRQGKKEKEEKKWEDKKIWSRAAALPRAVSTSITCTLDRSIFSLSLSLYISHLATGCSGSAFVGGVGICVFVLVFGAGVVVRSMSTLLHKCFRCPAPHFSPSPWPLLLLLTPFLCLSRPGAAPAPMAVAITAAVRVLPVFLDRPCRDRALVVEKPYGAVPGEP